MRTVLAIAALVLAALISPLPALAQTQTAKPPAKPQTRKPAGPPKWRIEFHLSAQVADHPGGGSAIDAFPAGAVFPTVNTDIFSTTRSIPSWFFGDGATLFNEVRALFVSQFNQTYPEVVPLDGMLRSSSVRRKASPGFGFRFSRQLTSKVAAEFSFDRNPVALEMSDAGAAAVEASRVGFLDAFNGLLTKIPQTGGAVTATTTLRESEGAQTLLTGALIFNLWTSGKFAAHAIGGVGSLATADQELIVELRGNYRFNWGGTSSVINESDFVSIELTDSEQSLVYVFGGGVTWDLSRRQGLRADVRFLAGTNGLQTGIDAAPFATPSPSPEPFASQSNPALQFSNQSGIRSSLSDSTMRDFVTFSGGGFGTRVQLGIGYFFKF